MRYIRIFSELSNQLRYASQKRVMVEVALIKLTRPSMEPDLDSVLQRLKQLEAAVEDLEAGGFRPGTWSRLPWGSPCNCRCTASDIRNTGTDGSSSPGGSYRKSA